MASSYAARFSDPTPEQSRRRGGAMLLAVLAHLLIILLLLKLAPSPSDKERSGSALKTFAVAASRASATKTRVKAVKLAARAAAPSRPKAVVHIHSHSNATTSEEAEAIWALGRGVYKKSDIAAIPSANQGEAAAAADASNGGGGEGDRRGVGAGPGGAADAEWYREPTEAEMRTYVPRAAAPGNWGVIVCQTAPAYRVENCRELEQSPPGVGISRALRQASFQFKVKPPVVNGKPMIGAWVRIRFYIVDGGMSIHR